jgi:curved DNA-binding protein CbpA
LKRERWPHAFRTTPPQTSKSKPDSFKSAATVTKEVPVAPKADPRRELEIFLERLAQASNHYEVLDVSLSADLTEIKRMYHTIARNFHPDRFHNLAGTNTHIRLQSSFARITQAYETLTNPELRSTYDGNIQALRKVRETQETKLRNAGDPSKDDAGDESENGNSVAQLAEKRFQEGAAALQQGQTNAATSCFSAAARLAPNEAKYRAYFGRALAANPKTQRLAEGELQAAAKLDPANASYHLMLAVLYRNLGFPKRAVSEVERALAIDPNNSQAQQLLSALAANK